MKGMQITMEAREPHASGNLNENFAEDDLWEGVI